MLAAIVEDIETPQPASYWSISREPLASLAFVVPLLAAYEAGVLSLGRQAVRNGADLWLRGFLDALGFGQYFLLPSLTVVLLLTWHHLSGKPWRFPFRITPGMALESLMLASVLVVLAQVQGLACQAIGIPIREVPGRTTSPRAGAHRAFEQRELVSASASSSSPVPCAAARLVAFLGAGIYEEVLFRLLLLPCCAWAISRLGVPRARSLLAAAVVTSLIFALAHYVGPHGDRWQSFSFLFRTMAGLFFAGLFVYRGFGIAAGAHAGYDILVGLC
jgi:membrane protease YdiL (CAAX protease family)